MYAKRRPGSAQGQKEGISLAGNRTPASCELFFRMTSRNTDHYTTKDIDLIDEGIPIYIIYILSEYLWNASI
jgi:hypothetical protein